MMIRGLFFTLFLFLFSPTYSQSANLAADQIEESLLKHAYSVVRVDDMNIHLKNGKAIYTFEYALTVLDKKHKDKLVFSAGYKEGKLKLKDIKVQILDKSGNVSKNVKKSEIKDRYPHSFELITDSRYKQYQYTPTEYPVTIHLSYKVIDESPTTIYGWNGVSDFNMAVEQSHFSIQNEDELEFEIEEKNLLEYEVNSMNGKEYSIQNLKPITRERYMPTLNEVIPSVQFYPKFIKYYNHQSEVTNWTQLGSWMYDELFLPQQTCNKSDLKTELDEVLNGITNKKEIAKRIYKFIQDETRYVAISLDDGGYVPLSTSVVHNKKYGDCKALSFYYQTLLSLYDIESNLAFVYAGVDHEDFDENYITPTYFNHVINQINIAGESYWADCTSASNPWGFLGSFSDNRKVLLSNKDIGKITSTPSYRPSTSTVLDYTLTEDGDIQGTATLNSTGTAIKRKLMNLPIMNQKEREEYQRDVVFKKYRHVEINSNNYTLDTSTLTLSEVYDFSASNLTERLGDYIVMPSNLTSISIPKLQKDKNRTWDIVFKRPRSNEVILNIDPVGEFRISPTEDIIIDSPYGNYEYSTEHGPKGIVITRKFTLNEGTYSPKEYNKIKSFLDKARKAERQKITFTSKS